MNSFCKTASEKQNCLAIQITKIVCFLIIFGLSVFIITQNMKPQIKKNQNFLSNVTNVESHNTDLETDQSEEFDLIQVITMTRHGTTTPGLLFPNDPNREEWERMGPPETLTHKGVREHCELGRYLARRYGQFVTGRVTHNKKTKIWSTDKDRSIAAAYSTLAGIANHRHQKIDCLSNEWIANFPPISDIISPGQNKGVNNSKQYQQKQGQHFSYPLIDSNATFMHRSAWINCKKLVHLNEKYVKPKRFEDFQKNSHFYQHLSRVVGYNITNYDEAKSTYESYLTEREVKGHFSGWVDKDSIEYLRKLYLHDYDLYFPAKLNEKLTAGPTLAIIVRKMQTILSQLHTLFEHSRSKHDENEDEGLMMLFGHTSSIMAVTKALGIRLIDLPDFAATFIFEIYSVNDSAKRLNEQSDNLCGQLWYKTSLDIEPIELETCKKVSGIQIRGSKCCPISKFISHLQKMSSHSYEKDCRLDGGNLK
ncbi:testicular acid phosphatase homolog [Convolutriloba macropyga]|uniref:testicular acid phosphatase homolog n=1 Tax=Convolutriloba macropyga TaxID=536237 RepID=UPI003F51D4C4